MATPLTLGQQLRLTLYLWYARPAFNRGLSIRPPPATTPTVARHRESKTYAFYVTFLEPKYLVFKLKAGFIKHGLEILTRIIMGQKFFIRKHPLKNHDIVRRDLKFQIFLNFKAKVFNEQTFNFVIGRKFGGYLISN